MLKQVFEHDKELQKEIVLLLNICSNGLDDLINSFDNKNVINCKEKKNATSP